MRIQRNIQRGTKKYIIGILLFSKLAILKK